MKKFITLAAVCGLAFSASAQLASDMDLKTLDAPSSYNLVGISYDNTSLNGKNYEFGDNDKSLGLNGFGLEYVHGFSVSSTLPMYVEAGLKFSMGFGSKSEKENRYEWKESYQMMRLSIPVSYAYRFNIGDGMSLTPYAGLDFRFNLTAKGKYEETYDGDTDEGDWVSFFDEDKVGKDDTWNRFQMGWHIGARFEYSRIFLGVNYGTDFLKLYNYDESDGKAHINTGNLAVTVGYRF